MNEIQHIFMIGLISLRDISFVLCSVYILVIWIRQYNDTIRNEINFVFLMHWM